MSETAMKCDEILTPEELAERLKVGINWVYEQSRTNNTGMLEDHLKARIGKLTLRGFRTVHGEQLLAQIAAQTGLGRSSLKHIKAFLSGVFKQAKRLGILDGINPIQDVSIPRTPEPEDTYAYSLSEINAMLTVLPTKPFRRFCGTAT